VVLPGPGSGVSSDESKYDLLFQCWI